MMDYEVFEDKVEVVVELLKMMVFVFCFLLMCFVLEEEKCVSELVEYIGM